MFRNIISNLLFLDAILDDILDEKKVDDLHVPAVFLQLCPDLCVLRWIVCRKGVLDPKTPAKRDTGYPSQAIQFLAAWHQKSIKFPQQYRRNSEQFRTIRKKFRQNESSTRHYLDVLRYNLDVLRHNRDII